MALESDSHGPASVKALDGGPPKTSVLGRAIGLAYSMGLHRANIDSNLELESDADAEDKVAVRAWWILVMLDRWNAIGAATPTMISNDSVVILPSLRPILGEACYTFLRKFDFLQPISSPPPILTRSHRDRNSCSITAGPRPSKSVATNVTSQICLISLETSSPCLYRPRESPDRAQDR